MREIVVNARFLTQKITGVQRFAIELSKQLKKLSPELKFVAPKNIIHKSIAEELQVETIGNQKGHIWEQVELPLYLYKNSNPLLVNFCNTAPLYYKNQVVTICDLSFMINPKWFSKPFSLYYSYLIPRISRKALKIITISENSKQDLINIINTSEDKIEIVYCSISNEFAQSDTFASHNQYGKYILAVSSLDPRKNFNNLIQAFNYAKLKDTKLVIVGSENKVFANQSLKELLQYNPNIVFTGYITDRELIDLYKNASLFLYPSLYEGFGIPPLEAMACGCPTIVSNVASLPEVCGNASHYIDPYSVESIAEGIETVLNDKDYSELLRQRGYRRVKLFSWQASAKKLISVLNTV